MQPVKDHDHLMDEPTLEPYVADWPWIRRCSDSDCGYLEIGVTSEGPFHSLSPEDVEQMFREADGG